MVSYRHEINCKLCPDGVAMAAYEPLSKQKAPKVLADALAWIDQSLNEFGIAGLSLRGLIEFLKAALNNANAAVRTSATKTLVTVKVFAGPSK
jgi:cytoskeleton-associated protein 5